MQVVENKNDTGTTIALDDKNFVNCRFKNCTLIYTGGDYAWTNTTFENCQVQLQGAAQRTAAFMGHLGIQAVMPPNQTPPTTSGGAIQ